MGSDDFEKLWAVALEANEAFSKLFEESVTSVGMDRRPLDFDSISIDCGLSGKRIAIVVRADAPGVVAAAVGPKGGDPGDFCEVPVAGFNVQFVLKMMQDNFARRPS